MVQTGGLACQGYKVAVRLGHVSRTEAAVDGVQWPAGTGRRASSALALAAHSRPLAGLGHTPHHVHHKFWWDPGISIFTKLPR